jgi:uncharacterized protein with GYD domain
MPKYLGVGRYTSEGLNGLTREGVLRRRADIAKMIESAGGKLEALYFAFGDADFDIIADVPDNISAAALSVVANESGFVTSKIIVLLTADEMDQAIKKATTIFFLPPGE